MANKATRQKKGGSGAVLGIVAIWLASVIGVGVLGFFTKGYRDWTFGNANAAESGKGKSNYNEQLLITPQEGNGIRMLAETRTTEEGGTVQRITAQLFPASVENVQLDWALDFGTQTGSWGSKTMGEIGEYLTLTPTADGAFEADIGCLDEFGTQAIVTATVRGNEAITASCTVDYVRRAIGGEMQISRGTAYGGPGNPNMASLAPAEYAFQWDMTCDETDVTLPFPYATSENFYTNWLNAYLGRAESGGSSCTTLQAKFSDVYTIYDDVKGGNNIIGGNSESTLRAELAMTQYYFTALEEAHLPKVTSYDDDGQIVESDFLKPANVGVYTLSGNANNSVIHNVPTADRFVLGAFGVQVKTFDDYLNLLNEVKKDADKPMIKVKITFTTIREEQIETVYNVKWNTSGLPILEGITLNPIGGIEF